MSTTTTEELKKSSLKFDCELDYINWPWLIAGIEILRDAHKAEKKLS